MTNKLKVKSLCAAERSNVFDIYSCEMTNKLTYLKMIKKS